MTLIQVGEEDDDDSQARRRCSTGDAVKLKIMLKRKIDAEDIENREYMRADTLSAATQVLETETNDS